MADLLSKFPWMPITSIVTPATIQNQEILKAWTEYPRLMRADIILPGHGGLAAIDVGQGGSKRQDAIGTFLPDKNSLLIMKNR